MYPRFARSFLLVASLCPLLAACSVGRGPATQHAPSTIALPPAFTTVLPVMGTPSAVPSPNITPRTQTTEPTISSSTAPPLPTQLIAYCSEGDTSTDIYLVSPDGSGLTQLTDYPGSECHHKWSPDGSLLAFVSERSPTYNLYVLDLDSLTQTTILTSEQRIDEYTWSPDSRSLAISLESGGRPSEIWILRADGTAHTRITTASDAPAYQMHFSPAWSPDGSLIAYVIYSGPREKSRIHLVTPGGEDRTPKQQASRDHFPPSWSPDGASLLFSGGNDLYTAAVSTLEEVRLTESAAIEIAPAWSPDGRAIAFVRVRGVGGSSKYLAGELMAISPDGMAERSITSQFPTIQAGVTETPSWSVDGLWIAFSCFHYRQKEARPQVCLVTSDGAHLIRLTTGENGGYAPEFQPK